MISCCYDNSDKFHFRCFLDYTSGDSIDWVYGRLRVVHSYGIELRPTLNHRQGFRFPPKEIVDSGTDLMVGLVTLAEYMLAEENAKNHI